jgi:hypothetical protein
MTDVHVLTFGRDELEAGHLVLELLLAGMNATPPAGRRAGVESFQRKLVAALEHHDREPSIEELQSALETLHAAGLVTVAGPGVPANFGAALRSLKSVAEFYADHAQYAAIEIGEAHTAGCGPGDPRILIDRGARARRALRAEGIRDAE